MYIPFCYLYLSMPVYSFFSFIHSLTLLYPSFYVFMNDKCQPTLIHLFPGGNDRRQF